MQDVTWKELQWKDNWYIVYPPLFLQKEGYSNIEEKIYNPEKYFLISNLALFIRRIQKTVIKTYFLFTLFYFLYINIIYLSYQDDTTLCFKSITID